MKIKIEIECDNDAFFDNLYVELDRILKTVPGRVYHQVEQGTAGILRDINGNTVGSVEVTK